MLGTVPSFCNPTVNNTGKITALKKLPFSNVASKAMNYAWYSVSHQYTSAVRVTVLLWDRVKRWPWSAWECVRMKSAYLRPSSGPVSSRLGDLHFITLDLSYLICKVILRSLLLNIWQIMGEREKWRVKNIKENIFLCIFWLYLTI